MTQREHHCPRCDEREAAHVINARRICKTHLRLVRLSWRYARLRLRNRRLARENQRLLLMLGMQQARLEIGV